jgi:hypothetical protein
MLRPAAAAALAALVLLAGCAAPPASNAWSASGGRPVTFLDYDANGTTAQEGAGAFQLRIDTAASTGAFTASFTRDNQTWQVETARLAATNPDAPGALRDFYAYGARGDGPSPFPEVPVRMAGTGTGNATVAGRPFADPASDGTELTVHFAVTDSAVRDPQTLRVTKADGTTPYDPSAPSDARVIPGVRQLLLDVRGPPAPADAHTPANDTVQGSDYNRTFPFEVGAPGARVVANITVRPASGAPLATGFMTFVLLDPSGEARGRYEYAPATSGATGGSQALEAAPPLRNGAWSLQVMGSLATLAYSTDIVVDYPEPLFLHVVYRDVDVEGPAR